MRKQQEYYTVAEFSKLMKLREEYIRQMCRKQFDPRTGRRYSLPTGWVAKVIGRMWFISRVEV